MHPVEWAEHHPYAAGAVIFVGGLGLLYVFGFFGGSGGSSANTGQANLAAAYYAAEAQQAVAGTQLNITTAQTAAQTAQAGIAANAAVAINAANNTTAATIASHMYDASTAQSHDALAASQTHDAYAYQGAVSGNNASVLMDAMHTIVPQELALTGSWAGITLPGVGQIGVQGPATSINTLMGMGYTRAQAENWVGVAPSA